MTHVKYSALCTGDVITAIADAVRVAKAGNVIIELTVGSVVLQIRPTSEFLDVMEIYNLKKTNYGESDTTLQP